MPKNVAFAQNQSELNRLPLQTTTHKVV